MYKHITVLLEEAIEKLNIKADGIYVDCTLGGGGHSAEILKRLKDGHLYAFDQDAYALDTAKKKLETISENYTLIKANFVDIKKELAILGVSKVDGIIYDLGVSSFQFDIASRGFSYNNDAKLDMRMDNNQQRSAYDVVNGYSKKDLTYIFKHYGEINYAAKLADFIVSARTTKPIETTFELSEIIKSATPYKYRKKTHPAKKAFQAIRIAVNNELEVLEKSLVESLSLLNTSGRIVVISFHSLEDRIVKNIFRQYTTFDTLPGIPLKEAEMQSDYVLVNKKIIVPSEAEIQNNKRSHSAKMRVIERVKK